MQAFAKEVKGLPEVPIVESLIAYDFTYSGKTYLLVVRNSLCVPTMDNNLNPPFVLIEAGLILNNTPKIHCKDPSLEDQSLLEEIRLRITFTLNGTESMFETFSLTKDEIENAEKSNYIPNPRFK